MREKQQIKSLMRAAHTVPGLEDHIVDDYFDPQKSMLAIETILTQRYAVALSVWQEPKKCYMKVHCKPYKQQMLEAEFNLKTPKCHGEDNIRCETRLVEKTFDPFHDETYQAIVGTWYRAGRPVETVKLRIKDEEMKIWRT